MDDHKDLVAKAQEGFNVVQSRLKGLIKMVESFKKQVLGVFLFFFALSNHAIDFDKGIHNFMHSQ